MGGYGQFSISKIFVLKAARPAIILSYHRLGNSIAPLKDMHLRDVLCQDPEKPHLCGGDYPPKRIFQGVVLKVDPLKRALAHVDAP